MPVSRETPRAAVPRLGVYVHWPFCLSKCPYCDFNSHTARCGDSDDWLRAYHGEIDRLSDEIGPREVVSVFFGGGTPSLMDPRVTGGVIGRVAQRFRLLAEAEITLEANPGAVDRARFEGYRTAGVNRLSIGVQALDDPSLKRLGRLHTVRDAMRAIDMSMSMFPHVSLDLIYARQHQSLQDWHRELVQALSIGTGHLSLYQLTIEPGTPFAARRTAGRLRGLPDDDLASEMYELTQSVCSEAGYPAYEVSNHSRPGHESIHNRLYWSSADWLGIGPGAHGRITRGGERWATESIRGPAEWLAAATAGNGESGRTQLTANDQAVEYILMGLRRREGVSVARLEALSGRKMDWAVWSDGVAAGLLELEGGRLITTASGRLLLDSVIAQLVQRAGL